MGNKLNFSTDEIALGRLGTADEVADGVVFWQVIWPIMLLAQF